MIDIKLLKSRINCIQYAKRIGLPVNESGDRCRSPFHSGSNNTSLIVYDDWFFSFSDNLGGDVIDFCALYEYGGDKGKAIRELAKSVGIETHNTDGWVHYTEQMNALTALNQTLLTPADFDYLRDRGLTEETIKELKIGRTKDGRLFFPYFSGVANPYVAYYATRAMPNGAYPNAKYMKQKRDEFNNHIPIGLQTLDRKGKPLVIAEGAFDYFSFFQENFPVISAVTGMFSKSQLPQVLDICRMFESVFIVYDNDKISHSGYKFAFRMANILFQNDIPFTVGQVPEQFKDISEFYSAGHALQPLVESSTEGISFLANVITDPDEYERFILSACRRKDVGTLVASNTTFPTDFLKLLRRKATSAPTENVIADEVLAEHTLIHVENVGFYRYVKGVWKLESDLQVRTLCDKKYGIFSTAQRIANTTNLIKSRCLSNVSMNKNPVWNFINGTLELETGVFREANPNDFCSIQMPYPYDSKAKSPRWEKFISEIVNYDPISEEVLQFIAGYVLFDDCVHEKIFVLTGSGSNGKTRFTMMLEQLFDKGNVTNLTPKAFTEKFDAIWLKDSVLNISGEIKGNLATTEEILKTISSGETIRGCFKHRDFIQFQPRAKLIFATNNELSSTDTSDGLARRLVMINFPSKFVDNPNPDNPLEKQKDINLYDNMLMEISGIFNWAYRGYKLLKTVGYFTESESQKVLLEKFKEESNSILIFYNEFMEDFDMDEITREDLFLAYRDWCDEENIRPKPRRTFLGEFRTIGKDIWVDDSRKVISPHSGKRVTERYFKIKTDD